jgi:hypothetical protein
MPTGPASSSYIIPPLTLSDTFYEWYTLTNTEVIDKLNRLKVYQATGSTGVGINLADDGVATIYLADSIPGDHSFEGNITFNGTVTTVNTNLITIDDYNLVLGAVNSNGGMGGTNDDNITNAGGGGIIIAGSSGEKYILWKKFDGTRNYAAWRLSDALAFTGDAKFYSNNNRFTFSEGNDGTPASQLLINTTDGNTISVETAFNGNTFTNINFLNDGSSRMFDSSVVKRFTSVTNISAIGITFGMVVRHDPANSGLTLAVANSVTNAESLGIVVGANTSEQTVDVNLIGYVSGNFGNAIASVDAATTLGTGEFYFLSDEEPGKITKTQPTITGRVRKPILYALGHNKAIVTNYVGNKVVNTDTLYSKLNASSVIIRHEPNLFSIGDAVRFEEGITAADRPYGSYVKASCNSVEEAEALGIISRVNYGGNSASSLMITSGYVDLSGSGITLESGSVYFLGTETGKITTIAPITVNSVRKPMLISVSPTTGIVQNYVGLVINSNTDTGTSIIIPQSGSGFRNKLINGNFDFWQRGTTFAFRDPVSQPSRYTADRWKLVNSGGNSAESLGVSINRIPLGAGILNGSDVSSKYGLEFAIGTGGYGSTSETYLYQRIEGVEQFASGYATVSFFARSTVTNAKLGISFRRDWGGGTAPDYVTTGIEKNSQKVPGIVMTMPTTWTRFSHTFSLPPVKNGMVGNLGNDGPELRFFIRAGSDLVGKDVQDAINPNLAGVNDYRIEIAQVQMEYGQNSTPFELNDPTSEFQRCQRYYQTNNRSVPYRNIVNLDPTANNTDSIPIEVSQFFFRYPVEMRNNAYTIETKIDQGSITDLTRSVGGFKANKRGASIVNLNYQAEAEL